MPSLVHVQHSHGRLQQHDATPVLVSISIISSKLTVHIHIVRVVSTFGVRVVYTFGFEIIFYTRIVFSFLEATELPY